MKNKHKLITICIITSLTSIGIAAINKLIFFHASLKDILPKSKIFFYDWRFGKIYYTKRGHGKPLLLLHDLIPGSCDIEWKHTISELSKSNTVYTLDLLGYGRSEKPAITYTNYLYVQLVTDFIKKIIGKRTDLIASGSSSSIAIMACSADSALFDRIMLVNPDSMIRTNQIPTKRTKMLKLLIEFPLIGTLVYNIMTSRFYLKKDFVTRYFANPLSASKQCIDSYYEAAHLGESNSKYIFSSLKGNYVNFSISHKLESIDNSIYLVGGLHEPSIKQTIADYQNLNPIIESGLIEQSKHFPHTENPDAFLELCNIFLH